MSFIKLKIHSLEKVWWIFLSFICILEFLGRWVFLNYHLDFWLINTKEVRIISGDKTWFFDIIEPLIANPSTGIIILTIGLLGSLGILSKKVRIPALVLTLFCYFLFLESQPIINHAGDSLLIAILLSVLFGGKYKWFFVQITMLLQWGLSSLSKFLYGNWISENPFSNILQNKALAYDWIRGVPFLSEFSPVISFLMPFLQAFFTLSILLYFFTHHRKIKYIGCIFLPCIFGIGLISFLSVGTFGFKVILGSLSFLFWSPHLKFKFRYLLRSIPILYFITILASNLSFQYPLADSVNFTPFDKASFQEEEKQIFLEDHINKGPWITHRYARLYARAKLFYVEDVD